MWWRYLYEKKTTTTKSWLGFRLRIIFILKLGFWLRYISILIFILTVSKHKKFKNIFNLFFYLQPNRKQSKTIKNLFLFRQFSPSFVFIFVYFLHSILYFICPIFIYWKLQNSFQAKSHFESFRLNRNQKSVAQIKALNNKQKKIQII